MRGMLVAAIAMAACGSSAGARPPDARVIDAAGPDADLAATCRALSDQFDAAIAKGRGTCAHDTDCDLIGGQFADWYCNGHPSIGSCEGTPIAKNAPGYADAVQASHDFFAQCFDSGINDIFDCAPIEEVHCQPNGTCNGPVAGSCFPPMPDAGAPDAGS